MIRGAHIAAKIGGMSPVLVPGVQKWQAECSNAELDGATAESEGFEDPDDGLGVCAWSLELVIDILLGSMVSLKNGTLITDLKLFAHIDATDPIIHMPRAKVFRAVPMGEVNGRFTYSVSGKSKGPFTFNDPSDTP